MPGLMTTRCPGSRPETPAPSDSTTPAPSAPRIRGFGTDGSPFRIQTSRWFSADGAQPDEHLARSRLRVRGVLEDEHLGAAVLVDTNCPHPGHTIHVTGHDLQRIAEELGLDAVGATPAVAYERDRARTSATAARAVSSPT